MKKTIIAITVLFMLGMAPSCLADDVDISFDKITRQLTISGDLGTVYGNSKIISIIIPDGESLPEITDSEYADGKVGVIDKSLNIMQTSSDENGKYAHKTFKIDDDTEGYFNVYTAANTMDNSIAEKFFIPNKDKVNTFLEKIKAANNRDGVFALLEEELSSPTFGADLRYYGKLTSREAKLAVAENIYDKKKQNKYALTDGINALDDDIFTYSYLAYFTQLHSTSEMNSLLNIDSSEYSTLDKQRIKRCLNLDELYGTTAVQYLKASSNKQTILSEAAKKDVYTPEALRDALYISTVNYEFDTAGGWRDAYKILVSHNDVLTGINYNKLGTISENQSKLSKIVKQKYTSCENLYQYVESVINERQQGGGTSGGTGGGNSSGGSGFSISKPNVNDNKNNENNKSKVYFDDVPNGFWAKDKIDSLYEKGIVSGKDNKVYDPNGFVLREEFTKMLVNVLGIKQKGEKLNFTDISENDWFYGSVSAAVSAGIVDGIGNDCFGAGLNITRQDMIVMTCRALEKIKNISLPEGEEKIFNDDDDIAEYAKKYISSAYALGIISGRDNNMVAPTENTTRAEAAAFVYNLLSLL